MPISEQTFQCVALEDPEGHWELHRGRLRGKPAMSWEHNDGMSFLGYLLQSQLSRGEYRVRINAGHVRRSPEHYYIPDVCVLPASIGDLFRGRPGTLEVFREPLPLVVEFWSASTGDYDVNAKIPEYQRRGDLEIWRLHPYERTLTAWRRQADGSYAEATYAGGRVRVESLPGVVIDLDELFDA